MGEYIEVKTAKNFDLKLKLSKMWTGRFNGKARSTHRIILGKYEVKRPSGDRGVCVRADSHYTSRFRSVAERHRSEKFSNVLFKRRCSHWEERLRHVSVPFRRRARMFDVTERVRTGLNLLDTDNVNSNYVTPTARRECLLAMSAAWLSPELAEKLIELVRKCEQWYDISNKKFSDRVWKEKLWGQIGDELKKSGKFRCSFIAHIAVTIILLSPKF